MSKKSSMNIPTLIFIDIISFFLTIIPGLIAWSITVFFIWYSTFPLVFKIVTALFILVFSLISTIALIRICLPKLKAGMYKVGLNKMTFAWFMHMAIGRAIYVSCLADLIMCMNIFKFLYFRALGATFPYQITTALRFDIVDASLVSIGKHSVIGDKTSISCHMFRGNLLVLSPTVIGEHVQISAACVIGPGNHIGNHCKLGYGSKLLNRTLEPYTKINDHQSD